MSNDTSPHQRRRKVARIVRCEVYSYDGESAYGEAWAAVEGDDNLITCGPDIAAVTQAARYAGFWIADKMADADA